MWHMAFGYVIVRALMPMVHLIGRGGLEPTLHRDPQRAAPTIPYCELRRIHGRGLLLPPRRLAAVMDNTIDALDRRLADEPAAQLSLSMHFPARWTPISS